MQATGSCRFASAAATRRARRLARPFALALTLCAGLSAGGEPSEELRRRVEVLQAGGAVEAGGEPLLAAQALPLFYERRGFAPAWTPPRSGPDPGAELKRWLAEAADYGLDPADYHAEALRRLPAKHRPAAVDRDLLLTDAFLVLGAHLVGGRVHPETFDPEWVAVHREVDLVRALERALAGAGVDAVLRDLQPRHERYRLLLEALARYRAWEAAGGWPTVPEGERLELGSAGPRVRALRRRLAATGELDDAAGDTFDADLQQAVIRFQRRHGLAADGRVGPKTQTALNASAGERAHLIELNLERWRWLPLDLGARHIVVNLPAFALEVVEDDRAVLEMRVIVGRPYRRTPVFSDLMRYVVLNPFWEVPASIAVQDKLPLIQKDPAYLTDNGFVVYSGWGVAERRLDPAAIDWASLGRGNFPYRLRQDPGPLNALGRIKFMFPNTFNVYLHDTPSRELFAAEDRSLSSGCIRVERPVELAELVLGDDPRWSRAPIAAALASGATVTVNLSRPLPVHLQHWTAWVEADGGVAFRGDLYGRDGKLDEALARRREALVSSAGSRR